MPGAARTILFPTLNLKPEQELLPKLGVYATESVVGGKLYSSVTNVGTRPTFNESGVTVESHLFGFSQMLTGGAMEVRFHARIRDERKFAGPRSCARRSRWTRRRRENSFRSARWREIFRGIEKRRETIS